MSHLLFLSVKSQSITTCSTYKWIKLWFPVVPLCLCFLIPHDCKSLFAPLTAVLVSSERWEGKRQTNRSNKVLLHLYTAFLSEQTRQHRCEVAGNYLQIKHYTLKHTVVSWCLSADYCTVCLVNCCTFIYVNAFCQTPPAWSCLSLYNSTSSLWASHNIVAILVIRDIGWSKLPH